ncbi:MAG: glycosyltransferase [Bacteroidetes bacterium]|nr:glycosyltransferase [Bacteroidota bacterium]
MKKIIISVTNDLVSDQRTHKTALSLTKWGTSVLLIGRKRFNSLPLNVRPYKTKRFRLLFNKGPCFYAEYNTRLFFYLLFASFDIAVSNDLDTLPANFTATKLRGKKLVYDSHEYFTEVPELKGRNTTRRIWLAIEKFILPKVKYSYTVCDSIAKIYHAKYGIQMKVVRNLPESGVHNKSHPSSVIRHPSSVIRHQPSVIRHQPSVISSVLKFKNGDKKIIIYQGALNVGRGIETVIRAMQLLEDAVFVVIGDGDIREQLKDIVLQLGVKEKVIFTGKIPFEELPQYTQQADVGISLEENNGLNYYYSLPNKLFDYIQAGIPVLVSDLPEVKAIVNTYQIGRVAENHSVNHIAETIRFMLNDQNQRAIWKTNIDKAAKELCWANEEKIIAEIYRPLL